MTEFGEIISYSRQHHVGIIKAESDGAELVADYRNIEESGLQDLKRHGRVAFDRIDHADGHAHAEHIVPVQPIGAGSTHRHMGDARWRVTRTDF
ncbi:hypothetical protein [Sphingomicrobium sediminis]|uniref:Uncharacterized protein n=1 Tax=Sphingomicrobium sediminis TaxID=2950949 RepID=A0A9X2EFX3_9SPHN|nr:hypothetical protein [Sphingomicrobium sediminis]MCM8557263.1 hypothetical protein [Sphingomicrobium sediminis]